MDGFLLALWGVLLACGVIGYFALTLPPVNDLALAERRPSVTLLAADGSLVATFGDLYGEPLRIKDMPKALPQAVIATEDRRFYSHFGVDVWGLMRAAFADLRAGHVVQGGSTITQQLAKNLFLTNERTFTRKIQETMLALWLEHQYTKDQILELYLNRVYLGAGTYGVDAAAHRYFGKSARAVTLYESAVIAGLLKAPTRFSPAHDRERAAERTQQVLANMIEAGFITTDAAKAALAGERELARTARPPPGGRYFADWVGRASSRASGLGEAQGRDVVVTTTLRSAPPGCCRGGDRRYAHARRRERRCRGGRARRHDARRRGARAGRRARLCRQPVRPRDPGAAPAGLVVQAVRLSRRAGEAAACARPTSSTTGAIRIGNWEPHNYENKYLGEITAAEALAQSVNTVAAQVIERAGVDNTIAVAHRLGITTEIPRDASIALGTSEVTLMDLTTAYAAFASGGIGAWPYGINEVRDTSGHVIYRRSGAGPGRVIDPTLAGEMNEMLMGVMSHGTGKSAQLDRPAAGKTGTTQEFRDALFVGFTADLVAGVWLGNDDNTPMRHVTGGTLPARTWKMFMQAATQGMPVRPLPLAAPPPPRIAQAAPHEGGGVLGGLGNLLHSIFGGGR